MTGKNHSIKLARIKDVAELDPEILGESTAPGFTFKYIDLSSVKGGRVGEHVESMTFAAAPGRARKLVKEGDILLGMVRPYLKPFAKVQRVFDGHVASTGFAVIRAKPDVTDPEYLYQTIWSDGVSKQIHQMVTGSNYPALSVGDVKDLKVPLPPLAEQRKIAEILRTWDEAIETAEAELKAKQDRKRWLTGKFFSRSLISVGIENAKNEWPKRPLGELTEVLDGKRKPISKEFRKPGPFPYFGACGVVDYVDSYLFNEPLVLVGEDGAKWGAGESTAFIVNGKYWVNNHAHVLRPNRDVIMDYWMMAWLNFRDLSEFVSGLTVPKLNQANLRAIPIPVPPLVQQRKFVQVLQASDADIEAASNRIVSLRAQKRGLMQKLLTGEVRVAA
jgi:type I restriction enzyme S subunit